MMQRTIARWWIALALAASSVPAVAASTGPGAYKISGVAVDVAAATPLDARTAAYREAERRAWPLLWARLTGGEPAAAPHLADGSIEGMVAGVEIEAEQFSMTRYIGRLAIVFDRDRASGYLGGASGMQAPPMLLLPVMLDGGQRELYRSKTPWLAAWLRFRDAASALDYVMPAASPGDNVVLTAYQSRRSDRTLWRNLLSRFRASDVLTAEAKLDRSYPGGPVAVLAIARHGPDAVELGRVSLRAANTAGLDATLDEAVRQVDAIYVRALREGRLSAEPGLIVELAPLLVGGTDIGETTPSGVSSGGIEASVVTPDAHAWAEIEAILRGTPTVQSVGLLGLSLGGTSRIVIRSNDSLEALAYQLDQRGLRLAPIEGGVLLRRKQP
ncbi:MAG: hypothetical protein ACRYG4_02430, partial [Janthinobacterium lividum]